MGLPLFKRHFGVPSGDQEKRTRLARELFRIDAREDSGVVPSLNGFQSGDQVDDFPFCAGASWTMRDLVSTG
jgi:hypothetical protein